MALIALILSALSVILIVTIIVRLSRLNSSAPDFQPFWEQIRITLETSEKSIKDDLQRTRNDLLNITKENREELNKAIVLLSQQLVQDAKNNREELNATLVKLNQQINLDSKANRDELALSLKAFSDTVSGRLQELTSTQQNQFEALRISLVQDAKNSREELNATLVKLNQQINLDSKANRDELALSLKTFSDTVSGRLQELTSTQQNQFEALRISLVQDAKNSREELNATLVKLNQQINLDSKANRDELALSLKAFSDTVSGRLQELTSTQQNQFEVLRASIEDKLGKIQKDNSEKLEQMRITVDEKLHETLEKRLGDSFKIVSERLELVQKGLGEMQSLATGVGDLKRVLTNVKTRGVLGEIQLESLLEQLLTHEQYEKNYKPNPRRDEIVEFAIRLPGRDDDNQSVFLPIDAKFPIEDYQRLLDAFEVNDLAAIETAQKNMATRIKGCARDISDKYIKPPFTTDFALLFLPFEGLYAEVLRNPGLFETVQRDYHVIITGPTTIAAILNSLQLGFKTLAIEKRSSEVWQLLSAIKADFGKFGDILEKTQKKLQEAGNVIEKASHRSKQIQRRLNKVQELPTEETKNILLDIDDVDVIDVPDDTE